MDEEKKVNVSQSADTGTAPTQNTGDNTNTSSPANTGGAQATTKAPSQQTYNASASAYNKAMSTLQAAENTAPDFSSDYDMQINDLYSKITSREPFKYDYSTDPLYEQYRDQYVTGGKQAMKDTMGQTAALTGGYGNSYGSAVGQQQYDAYLQRLNDVLPDLYANARSEWEYEGQQLKDQYAMATDMRNAEYSQFRDAVSDQQYQQAMDIQNAETMAQYGDFDGYGEIFGDEAANKMKMTWASANPLAAYQNGAIDGEQYYAITGTYPIGYTPAGAAGVGGGDYLENWNRSTLGGSNIGSNGTSWATDKEALANAGIAPGSAEYNAVFEDHFRW